MIAVVFLFAFIWGVIWALFIQRTRLGHFLVFRRTWITVVVGVGLDLILAAVITPWRYWWPMALIVFLSSVGIITRSLINEAAETEEQLDVLENQTSKQNDLES